jgi:hypothetical protein
MATLGVGGLLRLHWEVEGTKGNPFEVTTWRGVAGDGPAAEVGVDGQWSSATTHLERGGAAPVAKL